jgi:anion-transporting  ArsA/GET3 family ATPase
MSQLTGELAGKRVVICAGAGGVGKTTVSAGLALGLARRGHRVALITIDPARRLAEALGLDALSNHPQPVGLPRHTEPEPEPRGELFAMMLDAKRTFDELIELLAPDAMTREQILGNPIYGHLSTAVAGSQEYTAIAKLFELEHSGEYDVIVLDTPPSRHAIDFLRAPDRLLGFLEGRALTAFLRPTGHAARAAGLVFTALRHLTGVALLEDLTDLFQLLAGLLDGFRHRAVDVQTLLTAGTTAFLIVTSPESAALEEAILFGEELDRAGMRRGGVIVNRVHPLDGRRVDQAAVASRVTAAVGGTLAGKILSAHADVQRLARRDRAAVERLRTALRQEPVCLADRVADVHDLGSLAALERELYG